MNLNFSLIVNSWFIIETKSIVEISSNNNWFRPCSRTSSGGFREFELNYHYLKWRMIIEKQILCISLITKVIHIRATTTHHGHVDTSCIISLDIEYNLSSFKWKVFHNHSPYNNSRILLGQPIRIPFSKNNGCLKKHRCLV